MEDIIKKISGNLRRISFAFLLSMLLVPIMACAREEVELEKKDLGNETEELKLSEATEAKEIKEFLSIGKSEAKAKTDEGSSKPMADKAKVEPRSLEPGVLRLAGDDRYRTAIEISKKAYPNAKGGILVLASGENPADALTAGPLAIKLDSPILLSSSTSLRDETLEEIKRLGPEKILIVGGPSSISLDIGGQLEYGEKIPVERLAGENRFDTSIRVAEYLLARHDLKGLVLANAFGSIDALAASAYASETNMAVVLTTSQSLHEGLGDFIRIKDIGRVEIVGGENSVSSAVQEALGPRFGGRISGSNRYTTAINLANKVYSDPKGAVIVNGSEEKLVDALAAAPLAYKMGMPILLTEQGVLRQESQAYIKEMGLETFYLVGGESSLSENIGRVLRGEDPIVEEPPATEPPAPEEPDNTNTEPGAKGYIALTFDDGPAYGPTERILNVLRDNASKATFFMTGQFAEARTDLVARVANEGHQIGNHSYDHPDLSSLGAEGVASQINRTQNIIYNITGKYPRLVRPTYRAVSDTLRNSAGMPLINWSVDSADWQSRDKQAILDRVLPSVGDGDIVLFHDLYGSTADAIEVIVPELKARGYKLVTVSELFEIKGISPSPGYVYESGR